MLKQKFEEEFINAVDPDQTAPDEQSDLGLHCFHKYLGL